MIKGKIGTKFPADVTGDSPIEVINTGGSYTIDLDGDALADLLQQQIDDELVANVTQGPLNAVAFGADPTGVADSLAAWNAMLLILAPTYHGSIYFPRGKYRFSTALTVTMTSTLGSLSILGDGQDATILYWPNAAGGLTITYGNVYNSAHVSGLSMTTGQVNGGSALVLSQLLAVANPANTPISSVYNVTMRGDDGYQVTDNWNIGLAINNVSNVQVENLAVVGANTAGAGIVIAGRIASTTYAVALNVAKSTFLQLATGFVYGDYVQGVTIEQCNFTSVVQCIYSAPATLGSLQELLVTNCQFNPTTHCIILGTHIGQMQVSNCLFFVAPNYTGIAAPGTGIVITGNAFVGGTANGQTAIYLSTGTGSTITGNWIVGNAKGIWLDTGTDLMTVTGNLMASNTVDILDSGTNSAIASNSSNNASFEFNKAVKSSNATGGIGYSTGAGGSVTQTVSRTAAVSVDKVTGSITLVNASGSATYTSFSLTDTAIHASDMVHVNQISGTDLYEIHVTKIVAGSCVISYHTTGGTTVEQPKFAFAVIKGATS